MIAVQPMILNESNTPTTMQDRGFTRPEATRFETDFNGKNTGLFELTNANGMYVAVTNYGARIVSIAVPDSKGELEDVILGFESVEDFMGPKDQSYGATVGRFANRIGQARFSLDGKTYHLEANKGPHTLHSASAGWHRKVWDVASHSSGHLTLRILSPSGEGGFPGAVDASVTFMLNDDNCLRIIFAAEADSATVVNMTSHGYFNLRGEGNGNILDHIATVNAQQITAVDADLVPTGDLIEVAGTKLDLRTPVSIRSGVESNDDLIREVGGYDHNYVLDKSQVDPAGLSHAACVVDPVSRRKLDVWTTQPGVQFYTGNMMREVTGKSGKVYVKQGGFCLETQHFPDSPNHPDFPSCRISPDEPYNQVCEYRFGLADDVEPGE